MDGAKEQATFQRDVKELCFKYQQVPSKPAKLLKFHKIKQGTENNRSPPISNIS